MTEGGLDVRNALATSEALLRQTLEGTQTGSWWWDVTTNVVSWSENLGPIHGLPRGAHPEGYDEYLALIHPDDRETIEAAVAEALAEGTGYEVELRTAPRHGEVRWIWARATVIADETGAPSRIVGLTRDITDRRRAAEREAVLGRLAPLLERVTDAQELADELAVLLTDDLADWCSVTLGGTGAKTVHAVARSQRVPGALSARLAVPLRARGAAVGTVLLAAGPTTRRYDDDDHGLLDEIGRAVAATVERLRLDRAIETARREADVAAGHAMRLQQVTAGLAAAATSAEIADVIVAHGMRALGARTAILGVLETPGELCFLRAEGYGGVFPERLRLDAPWPITTAVRTGSLVELADVPERRAAYAVPERVWEASGQGRLVAVPLVGSTGPVGALGFTREGRDPLTAAERRLVETLATQTALALERAFLFEANERARLRAEGLQRVTSAVATAATVEELADAVASEALAVLDVLSVTVLLSRAEDETTAEVLASRGRAERHAREEPRVDLRAATVTAETIRTQTPHFVESVDELAERWPSSAEVARAIGVGAVACIPLQVGERVGALSVAARERRFSPEERTFLRLLARACEHGLVRAALFEAEREARRRSDILHRLSSALSRALVPADVGAAFLAHALAAVDAASGAVAVVDDRRERLETVAVASTGTGGVHWPRSVELSSGHLHAAAFRTGEPVAAVGGEELAGHPATAALLDGRGVGAYAQPLVAGGTAIGAFVLCFDAETSVRAADAQLLSTMARVCAQAIERAHLYESEHLIALRLQRALLPESVAQYPGLRIAARYRAGAEAMEVGGDWYHTFELADGRVGISVGDVVGRGIEAAAAMGRLRSALAAFALDDTRPGRLVSRLDRFAVGPGGVEIATACYAVADPVTGILRYASAGHPPMLVVAPSGETRWLSAGQSPPLGAGGEDDAAEAVELLEPGSLLVAYSDGLVERRGEGIDTGLARLERLVRRLASRPVDDLCDRVLEELHDPADEDDVVLVALRTERVPGSRFAHSFPARPEEIRVCRAALRQWLDGAGVDGQVREDVLLAVHEALANAVEHAYLGERGDVRVTVAVEDGVVSATVADEGRWRRQAGDDPARGRGRQLIEALAQQASLTTSETGTVVTMTFRPLVGVVA